MSHKFRSPRGLGPEDEDDLALDPDPGFPVLPAFVRSISSLSGSSFRSHSHSKDCDSRCCPNEPTLSLENDESSEIRHFSCVGSNVADADVDTDAGGGTLVVSMTTGGGCSALDSLQQHLATMAVEFLFFLSEHSNYWHCRHCCTSSSRSQ